MLPADDYERLYRAYGKAAADAAFNREMRKENIKIALAFVALAVMAILGFFVF